MLTVAYKDKYHLWADVFRGGNDHFFVPSKEMVELGTSVAIKITLPDQSMPLVVTGVVVGLRPQSFRYAAGAYVRLPGPEVDRVRRLLGMAPPREPVVGRRFRRVACDLSARIVEPRLPGGLRVRNLSLTGLLVTCRMVLPRVPMKLEITLDDRSTITVATTTSWLGYGAATAGLEFEGLTAQDQQTLKAACERMHAANMSRQTARRIVMADDDPDILALLETVLVPSGYETYRASNGEEAADLIRDLNPSLVLLDLMMPGVDGPDLCRMMRADVELSQVPVIYLSALDETSLARIAEDTGASDYLTKPLALADLLNLVGRYLAQDVLSKAG